MTQYDVIRVLPFGGDVVAVEMTGALLRKVLDQGIANRGEGGFLQWAGIERLQGTQSIGGRSDWSVAGAPLDDARTYEVALTDFLLTGREAGLGYLTPDHPDLTVLGGRDDIRKAVITELRRRYGS